jgi:hypothetical protein
VEAPEELNKLLLEFLGWGAVWAVLLLGCVAVELEMCWAEWLLEFVG